MKSDMKLRDVRAALRRLKKLPEVGVHNDSYFQRLRKLEQEMVECNRKIRQAEVGLRELYQEAATEYELALHFIKQHWTAKERKQAGF